MAVASLVLGILSILFVFTGPFSFIGIILGIIGIVTGVLARREAPENTLSTGGLVTSIIGCALSLLLNIASSPVSPEATVYLIRLQRLQAEVI